MREITEACHQMMAVARAPHISQGARAKWVSLIQEHLGVDGLVWGIGAFDASGQIDLGQSVVYGRSEDLFSDYQSVSQKDPVTTAFIQAPSQLQIFCTQSFYRSQANDDLLDLTAKHRIAHLALIGLPHAKGDDLLWMTLYRSEAHRPFDESEQNKIRFIVPMVLTLDMLTRSATPASVSTMPLSSCTPREREMVLAFAQGNSNRDIANRWHLSTATVRTHLRNAYKKLGVKNKASLVNLVVRNHND